MGLQCKWQQTIDLQDAVASHHVRTGRESQLEPGNYNMEGKNIDLNPGITTQHVGIPNGVLTYLQNAYSPCTVPLKS